MTPLPLIILKAEGALRLWPKLRSGSSGAQTAADAAPRSGSYAAATDTTGSLGGAAPSDPENGLSLKTNTPPSSPTMR